MSLNGDVNLVNGVLNAIDAQIVKEMDALVNRTNERAAGHIQGLRDARILFQNELKRITQQDR